MNSKVVLLSVGVVLLLVGALAGYLYGVTSTPTKTTTVSTSSDAYNQVVSSFANHILFLSSGNASDIASQFERNATLTWKGDIFPAAAGNYTGAGNIFLVMNSSFFLGRGSSFSVGSVTYTVVGLSDDSALVNSSFAFSGQNVYMGGSYNGTISAQDSFVYSGASGAWLISGEIWDFVTANPRGPPIITG
jgi:hypothetical protein